MKVPWSVCSRAFRFWPFCHSYNLCPNKERFNVFIENERCVKWRKPKETGRKWFVNSLREAWGYHVHQENGIDKFKKVRNAERNCWKRLGRSLTRNAQNSLMYGVDCVEIEELEVALWQPRKSSEQLLKGNSMLLHGILNGVAEKNNYCLKLISSIWVKLLRFCFMLSSSSTVKVALGAQCFFLSRSMNILLVEEVLHLRFLLCSGI